MTAPTRRPSVEGALGNHEKRIGTLESIAPPVVPAQQLFPTYAPRLTVVSGAAGHRRWPGGVVVVSAHPFVTNATTTTNTNLNSLYKNSSGAYNIITHTQTIDTSADGVSSFEFVVGNVGLLTGLEYIAVICWRYPAAGGGFEARGYVSLSSPAAGWVKLGSGGTNTAENFFGLMSSTGNVKYAAATDTVEVKVGHTTAGGSAAVQVDYIVFFPIGVLTGLAGTTPTPTPPTTLEAGYIRSMSSLLGPTASYVGTSVHAPFSGDVYKDTQLVRDVLDPDFDFSLGSFGIADAVYWVEYNTYYPGNVTYPRHIYVPVRLQDTNGGANPDNGLWDEECFVTLMENGVPMDTSPLITSSWHFVYLGCHVIDQPNSLSLALWHPPVGGSDPRAPFQISSNWHVPYSDKSCIGITSFLDQVGWTE